MTTTTRSPQTSKKTYGRKPWWTTARRTGGMRSTFERSLWDNARSDFLELEYEPKDAHLEYSLVYIPDFRLPNGILVEAKGLFDSTDRTKMLRVKQSNPEADIRFVFMANNKINPKSKTRYSDWCEKHGFKYHIGREIPEEWWHEDTK